MVNAVKYILVVLLFIGGGDGMRYTPDWASLETRPLPEWFDRLKLGVFIHWGVFSVPAFRSEWFWWDWQGAKYNDCIEFMKTNYPPGFTYPDFGPRFTASQFDANKWMEVIGNSGAGYVVLTSKHHEGYTMWPSKRSWNWNSMDVGPHRDIVGEFVDAIRNNKTYSFMSLGLYHSLFEWFNPLYLADKANNFSTQDFVREKTLPELYEIVNKYQPDLIWSDGDWEAHDHYWNSTEFLAWLYNDSPVKETVITNDRWGSGDLCHHGGYFTCSDRYNPGTLQKYKWENAMSLDRKSWGYRRNMELSDIVTIQELIATLAETVSCGGNLRVNIGPTQDGIIPPIFEERLRQMGLWMKVNSESIYGSKPWRYQNDSTTAGVWYTTLTISTTTAVYAIVPMSQIKNVTRLYLGSPVVKDTSQAFMFLLGYEQQVPYTVSSPDGGIYIDVTSLPNRYLTDTPFSWAWVIRMLGLDNV